MPTVSDRSRLISIVQSRQNARVRELRAAFARTGRDVSEVIGLEGEHLLAEALRSGLNLRSVFLRIDADRRDSSLRMLERLAIPTPVPIVSLNSAVFASAVDTESPQGIAALVETPRFSLAEAVAGTRPLVLIAAGLQDPGNLGTLVRSAEAFGATGVLALPGTVSVWNAKTLRASAGSAFRVPVIYERAAAAFEALAERSIPVYAAVPAGAGEGAIPCSSTDLAAPAAILIGNEGSGLSPEMLERATARITIPTPGPTESLNASIAASILLYEAARQRSRS
ncbi:MAG TPA: RNA methyltransferase [Acidobacteriaceae bacterium]|nr:RNA methyltransferase [Acidobacteriaceae bacterium]